MTWLPQYTVNPLPNSQFIEIVVNDTDPVRAQAVANELARQLIANSPTSDLNQSGDQQAFIAEQVSYLEEKIGETLDDIESAERELSETNSAQKITEIQSEISALQLKLSQMQSNYAALVANTGQGAINTLSIIEPAPLPTATVGPSRTMVTLIAGAVAVGMASVAAYVLEFLDDTLKTAEEIQPLLGQSVVGTVAAMGSGLAGRFQQMIHLTGLHKHRPANGISGTTGDYFQQHPHSSVAEAFRNLRLHLDIAGKNEPMRSILVTSPSPEEGKTTTAANLAAAMAESGRKVLLLGANFEPQPHPGETMEIGTPGLVDYLNGAAQMDEVIQQWDANLNRIEAGQAAESAVDFLHSQPMQDLMRQLSDRYDTVIVDGPSLSSTHALALSTMTDGVLVVVRHGFTRRKTAQTQVEKLSRVDARVMGIVLNMVPGH
jgi:capsular exopolysaccharide synthesis family protein